MTSARAGSRVAPIVVYRRVISPLLPARCKYEPELLGVRDPGRFGVRHTAGARARGLAPAALQPVQPRRLRPGRRPAGLHAHGPAAAH